MVKITNIEDKRKELSEAREQSIQRGLRILGTVAASAGYWGFRWGRKVGYRKGLKDGHIIAMNELVDAWSDHTKALVANARAKEEGE